MSFSRNNCNKKTNCQKKKNVLIKTKIHSTREMWSEFHSSRLPVSLPFQGLIISSTLIQLVKLQGVITEI